MNPDLPVVDVRSRAEWREWLANNSESSHGVWVSSLKKSALADGDEYVSNETINLECLCFGWIDSKVASVDERRSALLCTPRKPSSGWSAVNKARVAELDALGLITERGRAVIDEAISTGTWNALDSVDALEVPSDLTEAFARHPGSADFWEAFPRSVKRAILEWIHTAKRPETRSSRVEETAEKAVRNERANQWSRPNP